MKMDFLPLGDVRTDPIINPTCLSDHVHTFYGANQIRPETTYEDLRNANGNSGNVVENKSLYWHPTIYEVDPSTGIHRKVDIYFASTYYIWTTGETTAFPDGFKMVAGNDGTQEAKAGAECVDPFECERDDGCESDDTSFFPESGCGELEVSMNFPTCWDGVNIDSDDHTSHVSYDLEGGVFDGECPSTHPVKIPQISFFFRIVPYNGGKHIFADNTSFFHADYFSGWKEGELQKVLDECENYSEAANPDAWCEDHVTFRDTPKKFGDDTDIVKKLEPLQPNPPIDTSTITTEPITNIKNLPRGKCTGYLIPADDDEDKNEDNPDEDFDEDPDDEDKKEDCKEDENNDFVYKFKKKRKGILKTCLWLKKQKKNKKKKICKKISEARDECPVTCKSC